MTTWMIVERLENWQSDKTNGFKYLGLEERHVGRARNMTAGDELVIYIASRVSAFADLRTVVDGKIVESKRLFNRLSTYDTPYPYAIETAPKLTLPPDQWVSIKPLLSQLEFIGDGNWRLALRTAIRRLSPEDAVKITTAMRQAATHS